MAYDEVAQGTMMHDESLGIRCTLSEKSQLHELLVSEIEGETPIETGFVASSLVLKLAHFISYGAH
jgi:hypothetical protein